MRPTAIFEATPTEAGVEDVAVGQEDGCQTKKGNQDVLGEGQAPAVYAGPLCIPGDECAENPGMKDPDQEKVATS
jgi:hypothetical protein